MTRTMWFVFVSFALSLTACSTTYVAVDPECEKAIVRPPDLAFVRAWAPDADIADILISGECYLRRIDDTIEIVHLRSARTP
jgi:hypothetical protein